MSRLVHRSAELHLNHIATSGDPFELGSSRPLDFGHWAAHKLEQLSHHELRHGEAVAVGIALDSTYSYLTGSLPHADWLRIIALFEAVGLPIWHRDMATPGSGGPARPCWPAWRSSVSTWEGGSRSCCSSGSARASKCTSWMRRCSWRPPTSCGAGSREESEKDGSPHRH